MKTPLFVTNSRLILKSPYHLPLNKIMKLKYILSTGLMLPHMAQAVTLSFGLGGPQTIPGSGGITYTTATIQGGTGTAGTHDGSGSVGTGADIGSGGTTPYNGTYFDANVDGDVNLVTSINSTTRENIDEGISGDYANYIGLSVSFSSPIPMFAFGFLDLDGNVSAGQNEWVGSFAVNGTSTVIPVITLGDATAQGQHAASTTVDWSGLANAPTSYPVIFNNDSNAGVPSHDPASQVTFDYGGALVDTLYFVWGLEGDDTGGARGNNSSGVTGFNVIESNVPEPSSAALLGLGTLGLIIRRKR